MSSLVQALEQGPGKADVLCFTLLIALAYGLAAQAGLALALSADKVTFVWPPSGLALAACLLYGRRAMPGLALGMLVANLSYIGSIDHIDWAGAGAALVLSTGSLVQVVAATALSRRALQAGTHHSAHGAVARYLAAVALACCTAATVGTSTLVMRQLIDAAGAPATWWIWWVGDTAGMLLVAPPLVWWRLRWATAAAGPGAGRQAGALEQPGAGQAAGPGLLPAARLSGPSDSAFAIVCMGIGLCMMLVMVVGHMERQFRQSQFRQEAGTLVLALEKNLALGQGDLQSLQSFYYKVDISEAEFLTATTPLLGHHAWQRAFGWADWVQAAQRPASTGPVQRTVPAVPLRERDGQGRLVAAAPRSDRLPWTYANPVDLRQRLAGLDLLTVPRDAAALRRALVDGEPGAVVASGLSAPATAAPTLLLFWPVRTGAYQTGQLHDERPVHGMSLSLIDAQALLVTTCAELRCKVQALHLFESAQPGAALVSLAHLPGQAGLVPQAAGALPQVTVGLHARHELRLNKLALTVVQRPDLSSLPWGLSGLQMGVLLVGLGFTAVLAAYMRQRRLAEQGVVDANRRLESQVDQRTAELSGANTALQAQVRERQRAEEALRMFRWFADGADQGLGIADFERRAVYLNPAMRTFAGLAQDLAVEGKDILEIYPAVRHAQIVDEVWPVLQAGGQWTGELRLDQPRRLRSGGPDLSHLIESFFVLRDEAGAPQLVASILTDISALKQLETQVRRARAAAEEANQAKSVFLANMSHEIRTPLNAVLGYTQLMREDSSIAAPHRERLGNVLSAGQRLLGLINDILDLSKIEAGAMAVFAQPFDLRAELLELAELMGGRADARRLAFHLGIDLPQPAHVLADRAKLGQMLLNLLGNAIKFTESGGVGLKVWHDGSALCFEVSDTGPGIAPDELTVLFAPFRQGDSGQAKGGTGLGLSITRRLAQLMGGDLALSSVLGQGTRALLRLPLPYTDQPVAPGPQHQRAHGALRLLQPSSLRVLVVEDDPDSSQVLCGLLRQLGCTVTFCADGARALAAVEAAGPQAVPDIVFTDIRMPVMNGLELLGRLRARPGLARVPVVAVSASSMEHQRAHFLAQGFDDFVGKPYAFEAIYRALEQHAQVRLGVPEQRAGEAMDGTVAGGVGGGVQVGVQAEVAMADATRAALEALAQASADGALAQVRQQLASLSPDQLGTAHAKMAAALASYDLERLELLARQVLTSAQPPHSSPAPRGAEAATPP